ncbi:MAG: hypothetical protein C0518_10815 [Opitutus sp.]|nr:hypothetical protein [Opitutus sp.]
MVVSRLRSFIVFVLLFLGLTLLSGCASVPESPFVGTWYDVLFDSYAEPSTREQFRLRADGTGEYYHRPFLQPRQWVPIRWQQVGANKIEFLGMPGNWVASATLNEKGDLSYRVDRGNGSNGLGLFSTNPQRE